MEFGRDAAIKILKEHKILRAGEKILWADTPYEDAYNLLTKFSAIFAFIIFWIMIFYIPPLIGGLHIIIIGEVIILLICGFFAYLVFYFRNHKNRKEANAITNQRILHYFHSAWCWTQNIDDIYHEQVIDVDMTKSGYIPKKFDVGDLHFRSRGGGTTSTSGTAAVSFVYVKNIKDRHEEFRDLIIKKLGGGALSVSDQKTDIKSKTTAETPSGTDETNQELKEIKEILKRIEKKL